MDTQLTPNFKLSEFVRAGSEMPSLLILNHIQRLAERLQVIRDLLDKQITITSGYRTPEHNAAVGGAKNSWHLTGMAADITVEGMTPQMVQTYLKNWSGGMGYGKTFTHLDIGPKRRWKY